MIILTAAKKMKKWFGDQPVTMKFTLAYIALVILFIVMMITLFQNIFLQFEIQYSVENAQQKNQLIAQRIDYIKENAEDMSALMMYNDNVQRRLKLESRKDVMDSEYTLQYLVNNAVQNSIGISTIILYRDGGGTICSTRVNMSRLDEREFTAAFDTMQDTGSKIIWEGMHILQYHIFQDEKAAITMRRNIVSQYTGEVIGMITININETNIESMYNEQLSDSTSIFIIDSEGMIVSAPDKELLFTKFTLYDEIQSGTGNFRQYNGSKVIMTTAPLKRMGWMVVRLDSAETVYRSHMTIVALICIIGILSIALMGFLTKRITSGLMRPVDKLIRVMESPDEMLSQIETDDTNHDEFWQLTKSFSSMQRHIQALISDITFEQQERTKQEIAALQTQITPHFLYNTLESVCALIQLGRLNDAMDIVKHIELFYRGILSKGDTIITLGKEIDITRQYIEIQKYRFEGHLEVYIEIDRKLKDIRIPKLTLQPLVENAVYHGFAGRTDGRIDIEARLKDGFAHVKVSDNGEGFKVTNQVYEAGDSYGLYNIRRRLLSYFGEECRLWIESEIGSGTDVHIRIPVKDGRRPI